MMRLYIHHLIVILLLSLCLAPCGVASATDLEVVKVGVLKDFPPQYSLSADGEPRGFAVDLIEAVADKANFSIQYSIYPSWKELHKALKNKEIDLIPNMGIAEFRKEWAVFSVPMEVFPVSLFGRSSSHDLSSLVDFVNPKVGVVKIKHPAASSGVLTSRELRTGLQPVSPQEGGELNPQRLKIDEVMEDLDDLLDESLDGTRRVSEIVQNLKAFSCVDEKEMQPTLINDCLVSTLKVLENELKYKATITTDYGELPITNCHPGELNQVFMNLLINAGHAIGEKGEIDIKTRHENERISVTIADNSQGIPKEKIPHIFEPFFTTKEVGKGTGLGLSIVYEIVNKHNGSIRVKSSPDEGTVFTVEIPVS